MEEHKVIRVSDYTKDWDSKYGTLTTHYCEVEGIEGVVEVNKKLGNDGPAVGEELYGTFTESDYVDKAGKTHWKFKAAPKNNFSGGGGKSYQPRDDNHIRAQWAIGQAMSFFTAKSDKTTIDPQAVEGMAGQLYAMVDRVKDSVVTDSKENKPAGKGARDWKSLHKREDTETIKDTAEELFGE